jgi:hypothetical protein
MSTIPLGNKVAVCPSLATAMLPVAVNVPAAGSKISALARDVLTPASDTSVPPAMSTIPLGNNVVVW